MTTLIRHELTFRDGMKETYYSCSKCGREVDWVECGGCEEGYSHHDCGEDTCCCLNPSNNVKCPDCNGNEGWWRCNTCGVYLEEEKVTRERER